jgi:gamma-glutamylcyclotransferase
MDDGGRQESHEGNELYFAYGTLLGLDSMRRYCPSAKPFGLAFLSQHEIAFGRYGSGDLDGGCYYVPAPDSIMYGVLYQVPADELAHLDEVAGVGKWYERAPVKVTRPTGEDVQAITYAMSAFKAPYRPPTKYVQQILDGASLMHLPNWYRSRLAEIVALATAG